MIVKSLYNLKISKNILLLCEKQSFLRIFSMKSPLHPFSCFLATCVIFFLVGVRATAQVFSITTCPAEHTDTAMNVSFATDTTQQCVQLELTTVQDKDWKKSMVYQCVGERCTTFDGVYSKTADGRDFYEDAIFTKYHVTLEHLQPDTRYKYRFLDGQVHYFTTSGAKRWEACIISDFHVYSPLYGRTQAAMQMIRTVEEFRPFDWILHLGDVTAWGGSYTFWRDLYTEEPFRQYMWAGVNGNHDNMTRQYLRTCHDFFRDAAAYPRNGYVGEEGVCYYFLYGDVLFIMLNNEAMKDEAGLHAAQQWVRQVVQENPARYQVVCQHYQWFYGTDGQASEYARWSVLFDELGIDLALAGNNHIYVRTPALYQDSVLTPEQARATGKGTVYVQTPSSDNERGQEVDLSLPLENNVDKIAFRWAEGPQTVGAMHLSVSPKKMNLTLLNRQGEVIDVTTVYPDL